MNILRPRAVTGFACMVLLGTACAAPTPDAPWDEAAWRQSLTTWDTVREQWVAGPYGPLAQVGLCRLDPATLPVAVGRDSANHCVVPGSGIPARVGTLTIVGDTLTLVDTAAFWVGEQSLREGRVLALRDQPAVDGAQAWHDALRLTARWADGAITVWALDTTAAARQQFAGLVRWPVDPSWRVAARFEPADNDWRRVPTVRGFDLPRQVAGVVVATVAGTPRRLTAYSKGRGATSMLVVIRDATSGDGSYPAGRFVDVPLPDSLGRTELDFNRARNPDCAFTLSSPCPLPPRENWFTERIEAGEQSYHPR